MLTVEGGALRGIGEDNGRGFVADASRDADGLGLTSIAERVRHLGGTVEVESDLGEGTLVAFRVPLPSDAAASPASPAAPSAARGATLADNAAGKWRTLEKLAEAARNMDLPELEQSLGADFLLLANTRRNLSAVQWLPTLRMRDLPVSTDAPTSSWIVRAIPWDADRELLSIGRLANNDIPLQDASVSKVHALLRRTAGGVLIKDADSMNGTYLNDEALPPKEEVRLHAGARARVGDIVVTYQSAAGLRALLAQLAASPGEGSATKSEPDGVSVAPRTAGPG